MIGLKEIRGNGIWLASALVAVLAFSLGSCGGGAVSTSEERVAAIKVKEPVDEPVFVRGEQDLLAKVEGEPRIAKIDPNVEEVGDDDPATSAKTTLSGEFEDLGENVDISPDGKFVYVPQPDLDRVAVVDGRSLRVVDSFKPIPSPVWVSTDMGSETLFALSEDGKKITGVDLETDELIPSGLIDKAPGGKDALLEGPERGIEPHFWATGEEGAAHYEGHPLPIETVDEKKIKVEDIALDVVKDTRAYIGVKGTDRLAALETHPATDKLFVTAKKKLGEPVEYVGADERRVYAATDSKLVVLRSESFQSLDAPWEILETLDFRRPLKQKALKKAPLSGMSVDSESSNIYLTLEGEPYVLSINKPDEP